MRHLLSLAVLLLTAVPVVAAPPDDEHKVIWRDPGAVARLDFVGGPGGRSRAPRPPFTFIEEDKGGSNPKVKVRDASGAEWSVKWGQEVNSEVFATRVAWAAGYFVEPAYFVARGKIRGAKDLDRAKDRIGPDGSFTDARFERKEKLLDKLSDEKSWRWNDNPFQGSKELDGLKIVVMLVSNWDSKDARDADRGSNTAIYKYQTRRGVEARYLITDWGGSMGKWGNFFTREKWDCDGFTNQTSDFVKGVEDGKVKWGYTGQHTDSIKDDIKVEHVRWVLQYVGRITDRQIRAGLRASGATPAEVNCFARTFRDRIERMRRLAAR
jgi:hypothetical protein